MIEAFLKDPKIIHHLAFIKEINKTTKRKEAKEKAQKYVLSFKIAVNIILLIE